jgi:predicted transglutaminase-like cysteine proteinase
MAGRTRLIRPSTGKTTVTHEDGDTRDIIDTILAADRKAAWFTTDLARSIKGASERDTCRNIWTFVRQNIRYVRDEAGNERIQSPGALWKSGKGDCKSFSVFEASCLRNLGIPYSYRFTAYNGASDYGHVYVVAHTSDGDIIMDAVHTRFDDEVPHTKRKDHRVSGAALAGFTDAATQNDFIAWAYGGIISGFFSWLSAKVMAELFKKI